MEYAILHCVSSSSAGNTISDLCCCADASVSLGEECWFVHHDSCHGDTNARRPMGDHGANDRWPAWYAGPLSRHAHCSAGPPFCCFCSSCGSKRTALLTDDDVLVL